MNSCASGCLPLVPTKLACASTSALPTRSHLHRPPASVPCLSRASCRALSDGTCRASSRALSDGSRRASFRALSDRNCSPASLSVVLPVSCFPGDLPVPSGRVAGGLAVLHFADDPLVDDDIAVRLTSLHCFRDTASLLVAGERHLFFAFSPRLRIRRHARHEALRADAGLDLEVWRAHEALFSTYRRVTDRAGRFHDPRQQRNRTRRHLPKIHSRSLEHGPQPPSTNRAPGLLQLRFPLQPLRNREYVRSGGHSGIRAQRSWLFPDVRTARLGIDTVATR
jgi:hypothetical protein